MRSAYLTVLVACTATVVWLVLWRLLDLTRKRGRRASRARLVNEWTWTLIPLAVLAVLLWAALK